MGAHRRPARTQSTDDVATATPPALNNALADLAGRIRDAEAGMAASSLAMAERALEAGRLLLEAKAACPHGEWLPFLAMACTAERQAQRLMTLARSGLKSDTVSELGMRSAFELAALRKLPKAGEVLALSLSRGVVDGSSESDGDDWLVFVWESVADPGYFHVAGWRDGSGDITTGVVATARPIHGEQPQAVFAAVDTIPGYRTSRMQACEGPTVEVAEAMRAMALAGQFPGLAA